MATRLRKLRVTKVALVAEGANPQADVLLFKAADDLANMAEESKTEGGQQYSRGDFAYTPGNPSSWKLRLAAYVDGKKQITAAQVGRAVAALGPAGFRGNRVVIPAEALPGVKRTVLAAWKKTHLEADEEAVPTVLKGAGMTVQKNDVPYTTDAKLERNAAYEEWRKVWWAFRDAIESIGEHAAPAEKGAMFIQSVTEFVARARPLLDKMGEEERPETEAVYLAAAAVEKAGRVMAAERITKLQDAIAILHAILAEAMGAEDEPTQKGRDMPEKGTLDATIERAATAEARVTALETELTTVKKTLADLEASLMPPPTEEEYLKSLPESLRKKWEDNERRLAEAEAVAKSEKGQREQAEYIQKTASYRAVGMAPDDWEILKAIDGLDEKSRTRVLHLLKSADAVIKQSLLMGEIGRDGSLRDEGTAYAAIETLAVELMKSGTLTKEQAIVKALDVRPDLGQQYRAERKEAMNGR